MNNIFFSNFNTNYSGFLFLQEGDENSCEELKPSRSWNNRLIYQISRWENQIDQSIPDFFIQKKIDQITREIEKTFAPVKRFNEWLDKNGEAIWYRRLGLSLAKLPMRAIRNIVQMLYHIIHMILYSTVHPLKSCAQIAKMLVELLHELTKPETWSKIGAGMLGACLGQGVITGNPLSIIGLAVGGALLIAGISMGALKEIWMAEKDYFKVMKNYLVENVGGIPESFLTGFFMGLFIGAIQRAMYEKQLNTFRVKTRGEAYQYVNRFVKEHQLPKYSRIDVDASGRITVHWEGRSFYELKEARPELLKHYNPNGHTYHEASKNFKILLEPNNARYEVGVHVYDGAKGYDYTFSSVFKQVEFQGRMYPLPHENKLLTRIGTTLGGVQQLKKRESA